MVTAQLVHTTAKSLTAVFAVRCGESDTLSRKLLSDFKEKTYLEELATYLDMPTASISIQPTASRKEEAPSGTGGCQDHDTYGQWSDCSKSCGSGTHFRFREHTKCLEHAAPHTIRYRQVKKCNKQACA